MFNPQRQAFADAGADLAAAGSTSARALLEALPAAIYTTDAKGYLTFFNAAAAALWGHQPRLGEARYTGAYRLLAPDGAPKSHADGAPGRSLRERRPVRGVEGMIERPDGTRVDVLPFPTLLFDARAN